MFRENIEKNKILLREIEFDKHNIQEMINLFEECSTQIEWNNIARTIKRFMNYIKEEKEAISDNTWSEKERNEPRLFEVEMPEIDHREHMLHISSYFGILE